MSALPRNGLRSGGRRGDAGAGAARAFTTSLVFFVDFSVLGSTDLFARRGKCPHNEQLTALVTSGCLWASAALLPRPPAAPARPGPRGDRREAPRGGRAGGRCPAGSHFPEAAENRGKSPRSAIPAPGSSPKWPCA